MTHQITINHFYSQKEGDLLHFSSIFTLGHLSSMCHMASDQKFMVAKFGKQFQRLKNCLFEKKIICVVSGIWSQISKISHSKQSCHRTELQRNRVAHSKKVELRIVQINYTRIMFINFQDMVIGFYDFQLITGSKSINFIFALSLSGLCLFLNLTKYRVFKYMLKRNQFSYLYKQVVKSRVGF